MRRFERLRIPRKGHIRQRSSAEVLRQEWVQCIQRTGQSVQGHPVSKSPYMEVFCRGSVSYILKALEALHFLCLGGGVLFLRKLGGHWDGSVVKATSHQAWWNWVQFPGPYVRRKSATDLWPHHTHTHTYAHNTYHIYHTHTHTPHVLYT